MSEDYIGKRACIIGEMRSYNLRCEDRAKLILSVFAKEIDIVDEDFTVENNNIIFLNGYICKEPILRVTPESDRRIADVLLAVNRKYDKSDYIPSICWGANAKFASRLNVGTNVKAIGRIQSREYIKKDDPNREVHTSYEVSISRIDLVETKEENKNEI
jgi:hypothetical protein